MVQDMNVMEVLVEVIKSPNSRTGLILKSLIQHDKLGLSVADLHRQIGSTPSSTLRDVNRLIDLGLVTSEDEGRARDLRFKSDSPFAAPLLDLIFVAHGVRPGDARGLTTREDDGVTMSSAVDFVPPILTGPRGLRSMRDRGGPLNPSVETFNGPSPEDARAVILRIDPFSNAVRELEGNLQTAYSRWHEERDRDLIHVVLHAGEGSWYAATHLRWGSNAAQARSESAISDHEWARGVYGMWAEAQTCHGIANYLDSVLDDRHQWLRAKHEVERIQEESKFSRSGSPLESELIEKAAQAARQVNELEKQFEERYHPGFHAPHKEGVGLAGERWLASAAREYGDWAQSLAMDMSEHNSFQAWKESNPEVLVKFPGPPDRLTGVATP